MSRLGCGHNPFPWLLTVRWCGLEIVRQPMGGTTVTLPDGQRGEVVGDEPCVVEQVGEGAGVRLL
jgi:hypothetical protein